VLAAALLTSAKLSNLPLLLPWALALLASIKLIFRWPVRTVVVSALAVSASLLPTLVMNAKYCGLDWYETGDFRFQGKTLPCS